MNPLHLKPLKHTLVSIVDGSQRDIVDDGVDVDQLTGVVSAVHVRRSIALNMVQKVTTKHHKGVAPGTQIFWAKEPIRPIYSGDPLAKVPCMGPAEKKIMQTNIDRRAREQAEEADRLQPEVIAAVKKANRDARAKADANTDPPSKGGAA